MKIDKHSMLNCGYENHQSHSVIKDLQNHEVWGPSGLNNPAKVSKLIKYKRNYVVNG